MSDRYEIVITGEAEVIPGPLRRLRELAEQRAAAGKTIDPAEILTVLDGA